MTREPFDLEKAEKEVKEKIAAGILPEGVEIATCDTPGCKHWSHKMEPFDLEKSASDIAEIYLKDPELQYVALVKYIVDLCRRCQDEAYENSAKTVEKSAIDFTPFSMPFIIEEILALRTTAKDEKAT